MASSPRRSAVAIAAVLTSDERRERDREADDHPHAPGPLWPSVRTVPRYRARAEHPRRRVWRRGSSPATNTAASAGTAAWSPGEPAIHDDVAEAGGAVVDRGDAQRDRRGVLEPRAQDVADAHAALGGDDVADATRGPAHVGEVAVADAEVERPLRRPPRRRPPPTARPSRSGRRRAGTPGWGRARCPPSRSAVPAGSGRAVAAGDDVIGGDALRGDGLGVMARADRRGRPGCPTSIAIRTSGVASAALRQRLAASPVLASSPGAPERAQRAARAAAAGRPSSQRPSSATPAASRMPARIEKAEACSPWNSSAMAAPPAERGHARQRPHDTGTAVLDGDVAERLGGPDLAGAARGGDDGELGDDDAHAERGGERDPGVPGGRSRGHVAAAGEEVDERVGERPARPAARGAPATSETSSASVGDQAADLARGGAERPQHRGLARVAGRARARRCRRPRTARRSRRCRPSCRRWRRATGGRRPRVAGVGVGGVGAVEHLDAGARGACAARRAADAEHADRVDAPGRTREPVGGGVGEEDRRLPAVAAGGPAGEAGRRGSGQRRPAR